MPSLDERREVAARLRKKHGERQGTFEPQSISIQAMNRLDDLLDCLPKRRDMFLDLADLIEPEPERTCQMEYDENNSGDELYPTEAYRCSACRWITVDGKPNYCPDCGAKVVE